MGHEKHTVAVLNGMLTRFYAAFPVQSEAKAKSSSYVPSSSSFSLSPCSRIFAGPLATPFLGCKFNRCTQLFSQKSQLCTVVVVVVVVVAAAVAVVAAVVVVVVVVAVVVVVVVVV